MKGEKKSLNILNQSEGVSRRNFLKVLGAGVGATAVGCADSARQNVYPYVKGEPEQVPGVAVYYNSTCSECSAGCGIKVRTREGRAVMIEGNAESPVNTGGLCAIGHSALQHMYDPDRVRQPLVKKDVNGNNQFAPLGWKDGINKVKEALKKPGKKALVTGALSGAQAEFVKEWCKKHSVTHVTYDPLDPVNVAQASELAFGSYGVPEYKFAEADVVLNFGADFMETWVSPCAYARDWAKSRRSHHPVRVIHIEPRRSLTGANADHWFKPKPGTEVYIVLGLIKDLLQKGHGTNLSGSVRSGLKKVTADVSLEMAAKKTGVKLSNLLLVSRYLHEAKSSLIIGGGAAHTSAASLPLLVAVNLLNLLLKNVGKTVVLGAMRKPTTSVADFVKLLEDMKNPEQTYDLLMVYGTNPVFSVPTSYGYDYSTKLAGTVVSFSSHMDETTSLADVILPSHTGLETWGSVTPTVGVYALKQPVMTPVFDTQSFEDSLLKISKAVDNSSSLAKHDSFLSYLKASWKKVYNKASKRPGSFERFWLESVERGGYFADHDKTQRVQVRVSPSVFELEFVAPKFEVKPKELVLYPYPSVKTFDGRAANRPWMQELPDPMTKVVWDTWAEMHPKTATEKGLKQGDSVSLTNKYGQLNIPVHVTDDVHEGIVAVPIGNGHSAYGRYAKEVSGGNVYDMLPASSESLALVSTGVAVARGRKKVQLVRTQEFDSQYNRHLAQTEVIKPGDHHDDHHHGHHHEPKQVYEQRVSPLYHWTMVVDLAACTGCSACVVACNAENNIPVVGKEVNYQGREMSWLRIERYNDPLHADGHGDEHHGEAQTEELQVSFMPMMCQHCQNAPCEPVCPVYATYHNEEGLNAMVYNRCVGTRYCANNCSYKVRRFNWFEYEYPTPLDWQLNPDVTKRYAGVMEKCTFCVQRIVEGKNTAKNEGRPVLDGEVTPACAASCPTQALTFGNIKDKKSRVYAQSKSGRAYKVLDHHLNTQPSVIYLKDKRYNV